MIWGPRMPLRTDTTMHLMRVPWLYCSPGHPLAQRQQRLELAEVDHHVVGVATLLDHPEMMSPSLPENSPNLMSSSASRSRCSMICFAVVAAIRPNPSGVSSYSPTWLPSSSTSAAQHGDVSRSAVELDPRLLLGARRLVVRREQRLLDRLDEHVEGDLLLPLEHPQDVEVDVHQASFASGRLNSIWTRAFATSA